MYSRLDGGLHRCKGIDHDRSREKTARADRIKRRRFTAMYVRHGNIIRSASAIIDSDINYN